ncbi:MAG: FHA domain-containing protein [Caldilineaceae bacterium]|nr:FHA domain-containing protein [Caldilineaceae bacterium]
MRVFYKKRNGWRLVVATLCFAVCLASFPSAVRIVEAQGGTAAAIDITGVDVSGFPQISVTVYGENLPSSLESLPVKLLEDRVEQAVENSATIDVGIQTAILLDSSRNIADPGLTGEPRFVEIANAVDSFVQLGVLSAQTDWLAAFAAGDDADGFQVLAEWNQDHQAIANTLRLYQPAEDAPVKTPLFTLIKATLDQIEASPAPDNLRRAIVVFSDGYDSLSAVQIDDIVNRSNRAGVAIHTVMIGPEDEARRQNLQRIADNTGGTYRVYDDLDVMQRLWRELGRERTQTRFEYRLTKSDPAELAIEVTLPNGQTVRDAVEYPIIPIQPVEMTIVRPEAGQVVVRTAAAPDTPLEEMEPLELPIQLEFAWPDGGRRSFKRIEYEIDGITQVQTQEVFGNYLFPIRRLNPGNYTLRVSGIDELGLETSAAPVSFRVETVVPTPVPTATPTPEPTPTEAVTPTVVLTDTGGGAVAVGGPGISGSGDDNSDNGPSVTPLFTVPLLNMEIMRELSSTGWGTLLVGDLRVPLSPLTLALSIIPLLLLIGGLVLLGRRRPAELAAFGDDEFTFAPYDSSTISADSTMIDATAYELTEDATEPVAPASLFDYIPPALLVYESGNDELAEKLEIEGGREVRIGRKPALCDLIIDDPRVSRLHASIIEKEDGQFYIRDEGSAGGTFVNKRKLRVNDTHLLKHDDIINFNAVAYRFLLTDEMDGEESGDSVEEA